MKKEKTVFEKIIDGEIPSTKVYEDKNVFAFLDISPNTRGHVLVVPKKPYADIHQMPQKEIGPFFSAVQKIADGIKKGLPSDGLNIVINNGSAAGQVVFHLHVHLVPRQTNDTGFYEKKYIYSDGDKEVVAKKIAESI